MSAYTPGPWSWDHNGASDGNTHCIEIRGVGRTGDVAYCQSYTNGDYDDRDETIANARLIAAAPTQNEEMLRYLPVLERAEADVELWERLTAGTGIATLNGYRAAIAKATGEQV